MLKEVIGTFLLVGGLELGWGAPGVGLPLELSRGRVLRVDNLEGLKGAVEVVNAAGVAATILLAVSGVGGPQCQRQPGGGGGAGAG